MTETRGNDHGTVQHFNMDILVLLLILFGGNMYSCFHLLGVQGNPHVLPTQSELHVGTCRHSFGHNGLNLNASTMLA